MAEALKIPEGLNPAFYAVSDGMMMAQARLMASVPKTPEYFKFMDEKGITMESTLAFRSASRNAEGACTAGTLEVLEYLAKKHSNLFEGMALLRAYGALGRLMGNMNANFHDIFLVKDKTGVWYAGSPANHKPTELISRMTRIVTSRSLETVMKHVKRLDGGVWPAAEFIEEAFRTNEFRIPHEDLSRPSDATMTFMMLHKLDRRCDQRVKLMMF